jgi:hypothetical protein
MLNKISAVARIAGLLLAIVAGFMPNLAFDVALVLVVLGLLSGLTMPMERMIGIGVTVLVLPAVAAALGHLPAVGAQLGGVAAGIALFGAAALASAIAISLFNRIKEDATSFGK